MKCLAILILGLLLAAPAAAQLASGDAIDVYDANGDRVGRLIVSGLANLPIVSLRYDGDGFVGRSSLSGWDSNGVAYFTSNDCTGTPYSVTPIAAPSEGGRDYVALGDRLFRFSRLGRRQLQLGNYRHHRGGVAEVLDGRSRTFQTID